MDHPLVTVEEVVFLHAVAVTEFGGTHGIRDGAALAAAVGRPLTAVGAEAVFGTPWQRAAALLEALAVRGPFVDGNRRTAALAAAYWLEREGWRLEAETGELADLVDGIAEERLHLAEASAWLESHSSPSPAR
jgi:death-on-curing protein